MRFALIDSEGSTIDSFEGAGQVRDAMRAILREDGAVVADLSVVEYLGGQRRGHAKSGIEFLASDPRNLQALVRESSAPVPRIEIGVTQGSAHASLAGQVIEIAERWLPPGRGDLVFRQRSNRGRLIATGRC